MNMTFSLKNLMKFYLKREYLKNKLNKKDDKQLNVNMVKPTEKKLIDDKVSDQDI